MLVERRIVLADSDEEALPVVEQMLLSRREVTNNGCWEYTHGRSDYGYGIISFNRGTYRAHRVAAWIWLGAGLHNKEVHVLHRCDNPPCFNPNHLFLGSHKDNMRDLAMKGRAIRHICKYGHLLTEQNIRVDPKSGKRRCRTCSTEYNTAYVRLRRLENR